jgi:hypothetical protein
MKRLFNKPSREQLGWLGAVAGIVGLAAGLRLWGITFGLPFTYHVDEPTYVSAALNLGAGNIGRQLNPPFLPNVLFLEYGAYYLFERVTRSISSVAQFEAIYRRDPSMFFLLGRVTTALLGVLNVPIVYLVGRKAFHPLAGLLSASFLALAFLHVRDSHFAVPDVMMTLLVTASVLFCLLALKETNRRNLFLAAFFSGMAIASKWSAWPVILPMGYVFVLRQARISGNRRIGKLASSAAPVFACLLAGFFLPAFQLLLKPASYLAYANTELQSGSSGGFGIWQIDTVPGYIFYLETLWIGMGAFLLILAAIGFLRFGWLAVATRDETRILLLIFPVAYFLIMGATRHYFARYALPLIPFLVLFAGEVMVAAATWLSLRWRTTGWALLAVSAVVAAAPTLLNSLRFDFLMVQTDTRTIARKWIDENIPAGSRIAMDWPIHGPALSGDPYDVSINGGLGLSDHPIEYYRQQGFDYLIASSNIYDISTVDPAVNAQRKAFYSSLDNSFDLVMEFKPFASSGDIPFAFDEIYGPMVTLWQRQRPGPTLKIYRVTDP